MDKIPRLRRKPKPPAIETSLDRSLKSPADDAIFSFSPWDHAPRMAAAPPPPPLQLQLQNHAPAQPHLQPRDPPAPKSSSSTKSPFSSLKFRASAKRARPSPPPDNSPSCPASSTLPHRNGLAILPPSSPSTTAAKTTTTATATAAAFNTAPSVGTPASATASRRRSDPRRSPSPPSLPAFLTLSTQEIDRKFQEITWAERLRLADALKHDSVGDYKWGQFRLPDVGPGGPMDRYDNIKPWNHNRIRLRVADDQLDYVNASAILLSSPSDPALPPLRYIAMQGPTEPSIDYVWRMVAEQLPSPAVIVQLTTMHEGGSIKCHQYFPCRADESPWHLNQDDGWADGWSARLSFCSLQELAGGAIEKRKLLLRVAGEDKDRLIYHFLYRRWPDFGVPTAPDMDSFFRLMQLSRQHSAPAGTRIVHCSAGVGRTGTFICLEHLMRELDLGGLDAAPGPGPDSPSATHPSRRSADPVFDTVESLRQQRRGMVQGELQYEFIYHTLRKLWLLKHDLPAHPDDDSDEPAAKRLEVADPFVDDTPPPPHEPHDASR